MRRWLDNKLARGRGFTIVELLIVIAVIGVLAAIVVVGYGAVVNNAHDSSVKSDLQKIDDAFKLFALDSGGTFPDSYSELGGLGIKIAADSYDTATKANMYICVNAGATEYAVIAMSRSQKRFVVKSESGISEYTGGVVWSNVDAMHEETCESIDPSYQSANGITGFTDGAWLSWTGAEGSVASIICPSGYIVVPGSATFGTSDFCVMKYEAKNDGSGNPVSTTTGTPWVSISQTSAITEASTVPSCSTCHLITESEWLTIAQNVLSVASNWSGGTVGSGFIYSGHNDNVPANSQAASTDNDGYNGTGQTTGSNQRRTLTLTNGEVIWDLAGNVWEWTDATTGGTTANQPGAAGYTWREWNALSVQGNLSPNPYPSYANSAASGWNSTQNIGQIYSDSAQTGLRAFRRGGYWSNGSLAGVFALFLGDAPSGTNTYIGFRVVK